MGASADSQDCFVEVLVGSVEDVERATVDLKENPNLSGMYVSVDWGRVQSIGLASDLAEAVASAAVSVGKTVEPVASITKIVSLPWAEKVSLFSGGLIACYDTESGGLARSHLHAAQHLYLGVGQRATHVELGIHDDATCQSCSVSSLCRRYWSPEWEVELRLAGGERAKLIKTYECALRMFTIANFLASDHSEQAASTDASPDEFAQWLEG